MRYGILIVCAVAVVGVGSAASADEFGTGGNQFTIDFVTISGDASIANGTGIGSGKTFSDPGNYLMSVREITNEQWDKFKGELSPVTVSGDPPDAYDADPTLWPGPSVPANEVSWYEAAQFVNWLNTSTGHQAAYKFTGTQGTSGYALDTWSAAEASGGTNLYRHKNAFYSIPTDDEWVKAGYWNGTAIQTYSNASPGDLVSGVPNPAKWNYNDSVGSDLWDVGIGVEELNGTFDMMGNVWEWIENPFDDPGYGTDSGRVIRGGSAYDGAGPGSWMPSSARRWADPNGEHALIGFRVARVLAPPTAEADGPYSVWVGAPLILNASGSTGSDGQIVSYMWDLDDDGDFETDAGDQAFFVVNYEDVQNLGLTVGGMYDIHLQITGSTGLFDTDSSSLRVVPEPATLTLLTFGGLAMLRRRRSCGGRA